jgi:hypothetical protein
MQNSSENPKLITTYENNFHRTNPRESVRYEHKVYQSDPREKNSQTYVSCKSVKYEYKSSDSDESASINNTIKK